MTTHDEIDALMNVDPSRGIPERIVPGRTDRSETADHMARYGFAATRVHGVTLDLGSGVGYGAAILSTSEAVDSLIAFDVSISSLAFGKNAYAETISFVAGDAGALPFTDNSFDSIACLEAIEHVPEPETVLREIARVLRPEGSLIISTPNKWATSPLSRRPLNPHHLYEWYPGRFKRLVSRHFAIEEAFGQSWHPIGITWRALRRRSRMRLKAILLHLRVLGIVQQLREPSRRTHASLQHQQEETETSIPTREEVLVAWPISWMGSEKQGIPVTLILIAKPLGM
jgi:SAM-dependent methyltransferase